MEDYWVIQRPKNFNDDYHIATGIRSYVFGPFNEDEARRVFDQYYDMYHGKYDIVLTRTV